MRLEYSSSRAVVDEVRVRFPSDELFGIENGGAFSGILGAIEQTFGGQDLYPSTQEKAANLLYFVVKDHPFSDGNKRSAAALFTNYLNANGALLRADGSELLSGNMLAAITLMTAMSKPEEKPVMIKLLMNMIAR
jgi:prophage maintenance system killer protein